MFRPEHAYLYRFVIVPVSICYSTMLCETKPSGGGGIPWPAFVPDSAAWPSWKSQKMVAMLGLLSLVLYHSIFACFPLMWCIEW